MEPLLASFVRNCCSRVNRQLEEILTPIGPAKRLYEAMRYSVLGGGKRIRPVLVYAAAQAIAGDSDTKSDPNIDRIASAVELIHAYSLIHDDLPAMDNDDLRRGKPTCHIAFDEATAILAGDALQCLAFQQLSEINVPEPLLVARLVTILASASGANGMAGGQMIDLNATGRELSLADIKIMHGLKTGALLRASIEMGALITAAASASQLESLSRYGAIIGLAFQVKDDILDVEESTDTLGKPRGSDAARNKTTYTSLMGLDKAKVLLTQLHRESIQQLEEFDDSADRLRELSRYIVNRNH